MIKYKEFERSVKDFLLLKLYIEESPKIVRTEEYSIDISIMFGDTIKSGIEFNRNKYEDTPLTELMNIFSDTLLEEIINSKDLNEIIYVIKEELGDDED